MADDFLEPHLILHDEICYPNFYEDFQSIIPENRKHASSIYSEKDWLTQELLNEINSNLPEADDIDSNNQNARSRDAFEAKCSLLFPKGRKFANHIQMTQFVSRFLDKWAILPVKYGKGF